jgi:hypothetical protein
MGLTVKLDELFEGFGRQKPVPRQQQASTTSANKLQNVTAGKDTP